MNKTHPNAELIERFYASFSRLDAEAMTNCYHENVEFSDPVFPELRGDEARAMWRMLCAQASNFELTFGDVRADDHEGKVNWEARYRFSPTGRTVHNRIAASFKFQDGKIIRHIDDFNFWKWCSMALGPAGLLLGWAPSLRRKIQARAARSLEHFMAQSGE